MVEALDYFEGVKRFAVLAEFKVEVWAGGSAGFTDCADDLTGTYSLAGFDVELFTVAVVARIFVQMFDDNEIPVGAVRVRVHNGSVADGSDRSIHRGG